MKLLQGQASAFLLNFSTDISFYYRENGHSVVAGWFGEKELKLNNVVSPQASQFYYQIIDLLQ
jgi:hypothetical protein